MKLSVIIILKLQLIRAGCCYSSEQLSSDEQFASVVYVASTFADFAE